MNHAMGTLASQFMLLFPFFIYDTTWILVSPFAFLCGLALSYSLLIMLTGSAVLVSPNVDPGFFLHTNTPFILLWIAHERTP